MESLLDADRERVQAMARAIASRLLHEPTLRLKRAAGEGGISPRCTRSASSSGSTPAPTALEGAEADVTELDSRRRAGSATQR